MLDIKRTFLAFALIFLLLLPVHAIVGTRILSEFYSLNAHGTFTSNYHYIYNPTSFYQLDQIQCVSFSHEDPFIDTLRIYCQTQVTTNTVTEVNLAQYHYADYSGFFRRQISVMDSLSRLIEFKQTDDIDDLDHLIYHELLYYGNHAQPDSIIINSEKWVFEYDELGRKGNISYYINDSGWSYQGYYELLYLNQYPYTINVTRPTGSSYKDMLTLFDTNWQFDHIIYHPLQGVADTLAWQVINLDPIKIQYDPGVPSIGCTLQFGVNGLLSHESGYNLMSAPLSYEETYTWEVSVPVEDQNTPNPTILLQQNYPNPFTHTTSLHYQIKQPIHVIVDVYNIKGQRIKTLVNERKKAGDHAVTWTGDNEQGHLSPSGIYLIRLQAGNEQQIIKTIYIK